MRVALTLLHAKGGYLYEHRPDLFPEGQLTDTEMELWGLFYRDRNREQKRG